MRSTCENLRNYDLQNPNCETLRKMYLALRTRALPLPDMGSESGDSPFPAPACGKPIVFHHLTLPHGRRLGNWLPVTRTRRQLRQLSATITDQLEVDALPSLQSKVSAAAKRWRPGNCAGFLHQAS